jgi:hypothetical protein
LPQKEVPDPLLRLSCFLAAAERLDQRFDLLVSVCGRFVASAGTPRASAACVARAVGPVAAFATASAMAF